MKKPIRKNWIKYWTTTIAVTGMLAMGSCDNNQENRTTETTVDTRTTVTEEPVTTNTTRENVASQEMEAQEGEFEQADRDTHTTREQGDQPQFEQTSNRAPSGRSANTIRDMDAHVDDHKAENKAIREELTEGEEGIENNQRENQTNAPNRENQLNPAEEGTQEDFNRAGENNQQGVINSQQNTDPQELREESTMGQQGVRDAQQNQAVTPDNQKDYGLNQQPAQQPQHNPTQQQNTLDNEVEGVQNQGIRQQNQNDANQTGSQEGTTSPYEQHISIYSQGLSEPAQQRYNEVVNEYLQDRENMRGQIDQKTGAYIPGDRDPQPTVGFDNLAEHIRRNIDYPETAAAANVEGIAFINVVIDKDGNIKEVQAMDEFIESSESHPRSFTENDIENAKDHLKVAAERAVRQTDGLWEAGEQDGQKVISELQIPVRFIMKGMGVGEHEHLGTGQGNPTDVHD